ncbi:class I SAM-dependent methyltransferase [Pseudomonas oryzihabitans]|uniref:class I SAM-dependent methyltransferase n=1 Tax=Pseudomonas oryzihabitans TaxID=47885 RepID=UPI0015E37B20|nr:class I SAM-dependent methyltransferase [Pseudomonas psychrotolerans]MBA1258724.1 class I SAM-dependent methyltransferase [Pseudomonas psychrotolerans]
MSHWTSYYAATAAGGPRDTLLQSLSSWSSPPGLALDLGCGTGRDTLVLLEQGWQVLALDAESEALSALRERTPALLQGRLETRQARFETVTLPRCDLINSSFALPFCEPAHFPALWNGITAAVRPGGLFCGQLFGERDSWASKGVTVVDAAALQQVLREWDVLLHREEEEDGHTAVGRPKHWHIHHLVLQRR